jgi:hypothetical protein
VVTIVETQQHFLPIAFPRAAQGFLGRLKGEPALAGGAPPAVCPQEECVAQHRVPLKECQYLLTRRPEGQPPNLQTASCRLSPRQRIEACYSLRRHT